LLDWPQRDHLSIGKIAVILAVNWEKLIKNRESAGFSEPYGIARDEGLGCCGEVCRASCGL
jgi:hypothetical protein